ncbi:MAG: hypothetical protein AABO58_15545 [Acidobacteriota bacterium]
MRKIRRSLLALALITTFANGSALAATRDGRGDDLKSRIKHIIIRILEDVKMGFPPG